MPAKSYVGHGGHDFAQISPLQRAIGLMGTIFMFMYQVRIKGHGIYVTKACWQARITSK